MGKGRAPCCDKSKVKKGPWSPAEDLKLMNFIQKNGHSNWRALPKQAGLLRCGKSCRLRWINYLRPDVKRGNFTPQEEQTIINLHNSIGNKWSKIASYLPGRTDNEIKNVWNTHLKKRVKKLSEDHSQKNDTDQSTNNDSKMESSPSLSCASSSITTSGDNNHHSMENIVSDQGVQEFEVTKKQNEPENIEKNSDSPTISNESSCSNIISPVINIVEENDDGKLLEIPFEPDVDFWELMDSLDSLQTILSNENEDINCGISSSNDEVECSKWLRILEDELGLAPSTNGDHLPMGQHQVITTTTTTTSPPEPEISPSNFDYFPTWPSSPQNIGI